VNAQHASRTQLGVLAASLVGPVLVVMLLSPLLSAALSGSALGVGSAYDDARVQQVRDLAESWAVYFGTVLE
jgi:hypothetical protein